MGPVSETILMPDFKAKNVAEVVRFFYTGDVR
jgi:hypothetical protein